MPRGTGERLPGSDLDAIEASSPESAARRATRHLWIERRQLFDHSDAVVRQIVVVVAEQLPSDRERESTTPTLGTPTRWISRLSVTHQGGDFDFDANAAFDRTQMAAIQVEPLRG
jgi:hypothetical protein